MSGLWHTDNASHNRSLELACTFACVMALANQMSVRPGEQDV